MTAWPQARLGDLIVDAAYGTSVKCSDLAVGVPVLRMGNVRYDGTLDLNNLKYAPLSDGDLGKFGVEEGDILFNRTNSKELVGKTGLWDGRFTAAAASYFIRLRVNRDVVCPKWVWRFMNSAPMKNHLCATARGAIGQANINSEELKSFILPLPPLDEQQRIVGLLDRAAEIRRRADAARAKARAIIPALFLDMFGDPATGWPEVAIADLLADQPNAIRTGPFGSQIKHSEFTDEGVPVLGIDNVVDNEFKWAKPRHLPPEKYEAFKRFRVFPGDVIITIMGTTGRVCVAPDDLPECMNTKHLCAFTLDRSRAHPRFIWAALLFDPGVRAQARGKANGQIMEGWNMGIVRSMRLPLPPLPLQTAFAEQANRLDALARALDAAAAKADSMAAALSAEVFG